MYKTKLIDDLENLVDTKVNLYDFPYECSDCIRIGNNEIKKTARGYEVYDTKSNTLIANTFCKTSALAIARNLTKGVNLTESILRYDRVIEKHSTDSMHYIYSIKKLTDMHDRELREDRLGVSLQKVRWARQKLNSYIFDI